MLAAAKWYFLVSLAGGLAWPLAFRHLHALPDRGYLSSRALGLLLCSYVFWLTASLGLVANTVGAMLLAALIVGGVSVWQYRTRPNHEESLSGWLRENRAPVIAGEVLFLLAFIAWTLVRAHDPALNSTEKPMELTFLNGIRASRVFPPRDPWLAGYAISYYYFGYVIVAMLADLSGLASAVAFNLAVAMLFALTVLGAYAVVYNLIGLHRQRSDSTAHAGSGWAGALLGPLMVAVMGNLAGVLELMRALRFPRSDGFWAWLDVEELSAALQPDILWPPDRWRYWWWWRASRVVRDRDLTGTPIGLQPIDEFPMFSFLLGDMHPHVLALPFVVLVIELALNLVASRPSNDDTRPWQALPPATFVLYAVTVGSLAFLNVSDQPIYLFVVAGAAVLHWMRIEGRLSVSVLGRALVFGLGLLVSGIALYLPFYIGFRSQLSGILPNALFPTRLPNFLVMFGPLLFVVIWFAVREAAPWRRGRADWLAGGGLAAGILVALVVVMVVTGSLTLVDTRAQDFLLSSAGFSVDTLPAASDARTEALGQAIDMTIDRRLAEPAVALLLTGLLAVGLGRLLRPRDGGQPDVSASSPPVSDFVILLIVTGALLTLGPEFVYLRDTFGQRLNTVFKFYYAAWVLFGVAAAYATWAIASDKGTSRVARGLFTTLVALLILAGMVYPVFAIPSKADFSAAPTLDGVAYIEDISPGDLDAIRWLQANADSDAVVLEAVGGQYSFYGRVSTITGLPTLLGWPGHELQWRGSLQAAGSRESDVKMIYTTPDMRTAQILLDQYGVTYIFVGSLERGYGTPAGLQKFERFLTRVYHNDEASIYRADQPLPMETP